MKPRGRAALAVGVAVGLLVGMLVAVEPATSATPSWSIAASPALQNSSLYGVSCPSTTRCFAVGRAGENSTLAEHWNGTSWSVVPAAAGLTGTRGPKLSAVACASTTSCFAVGSYYYPPFPPSASALRPLIEHWDGTRWSMMTRPVPTGARNAHLSGVSCPTLSSCFAVGYYNRPGAPTQTLVERWNGSRWSIMDSADRNVSYLSGVSCPGVASCYAVGGSSKSESVDPTTLVEHWDGSRWAIVSSPHPSDALTSELVRVSCPRTYSCFAVGSSAVGEVFRTMVEHWNGKRWSIMSSPNPTGKPVAFLRSVSCPSMTSCNAVGHYYVGRAQRTLVEHWNGERWSIVSTPNPAGATRSYLSGVSCNTPNNCFAVGAYGKGAGDSPLIERYR